MNFKFLILVLTLGLISGIAAGFEGGSGTSGDPYQISTCQQLQDIELDLSATYELVGNLNCTETKNWNSDKGFKPLGNSTNRFTGVFDGNNYVVKGLFIDRTSEYYTGLFGYTEVSTIVKNLNLEDATVRGSVSTGLVAGRNEGNLQNISISGEVYGANANTGGLTGLNDGNISLSTVKIALESDSFRVGGLTGWNRGSGRIENSKVFGSISGQDNVGGLAGTNSFKINNSTSYVSIDGRNRVGGLVGYTDDSEADVSQSSSAGTVNGSSDIGGLVGYHTNSKIMESYSTSNVKGDTNVGGLIGLLFAADVSNSFSTGEVAGSSLVGGLVGERDDSLPGTVSDSYWDINSSGQFTSTGGTGLTTDEMMGSAASSNMAGFDFQDTWRTQSFYYPRLQWMELGSGTESNPFMIYDCKELQALRNNLTSHYELANDIDCTDTVNWNSGAPGGFGFVPVGAPHDENTEVAWADRNLFTGGLDGANNAVEGVYMDWTGYFGGIFAYLSGAKVNDLTLIDFDVGISSGNESGRYAGALAGTSRSGAVIDNVSVESASVYAAEQYAGGLTGYSLGEIRSSYSGSGVSVSNGDNYAGGIAGYNDGDTIDSQSYADVSPGEDSGGVLLGRNLGTVDNSSADGTVSSNFGAGYFGALVGWNSGLIRYSHAQANANGIEGGLAGRNDGTIRLSFSEGSVDDFGAGGITNWNRGSIYDSFSKTDLSGSDGGGVAQRQDSIGNNIHRTFAVGQLSTSTDRGGTTAIGPTDKIQDSYYDVNTSNADYDGGGIPLTTSEMQGCNAEQNLQAFDFENTWIAQSNDYPALRFFTSKGLSCDVIPPQAPNLLLPLDDSTQVPVKTNLSITAEGTGLQNITFYQNNSGADSVIGSVSNVNASSSEMAQVEWSGLNMTSFYEWYAVAENSAGSVNSSKWNFTTEKSPVIDSFEPAHGSNTEPNPELKVNVSDDISNDIEVRFYDSSDQLLETASGLSSGGQAIYDPALDSFASNPGQSYEWYAVVETDSGALINSSESPSFASYWNFTTQNLISASIDVKFGDQVNMNNGSADIGRTDLRFEPWNPSGAVMDNVIVNVDGVQVENFNDVPSNTSKNIDVSSLGLSEDQTYSWSISVEDSGTEVGSFNGEFTTHRVDVEAVPRDDSHDSINLYYSENGVAFSELKSFSRSDNSPLSVKAANPELYRSGSNHCYTAATSNLGLESSKSPEVCIGGSIP